MAIKVIAQLREVKIGKNPGKKFVMRPDLYVPITEKKVFQEAATHSGISAGVIKAAWDAAGEVIRTWATEGHSIPLPGLGTMRFGVRSKAVEISALTEARSFGMRMAWAPWPTSGDIEDNENGGENQNSDSNSGTDIPPVINP